MSFHQLTSRKAVNGSIEYQWSHEDFARVYFVANFCNKHHREITVYNPYTDLHSLQQLFDEPDQVTITDSVLLAKPGPFVLPFFHDQDILATGLVPIDDSCSIESPADLPITKFSRPIGDQNSRPRLDIKRYTGLPLFDGDR